MQPTRDSKTKQLFLESPILKSHYESYITCIDGRVKGKTNEKFAREFSERYDKGYAHIWTIEQFLQQRLIHW